MPRQLPSCRRAVQSLSSAPQHVWVTDELLASTFQRFSRDSCPQQKRHGSHVPGPLEARRRASKRRMTVSAGYYPQDSFPSPFNLGAWFGFGQRSKPLWRYEPPSCEADSLPSSVSSPATATIDPIDARCASIPAESVFPRRTWSDTSSLTNSATIKQNIQDDKVESIARQDEEVHPGMDIEACFALFRAYTAKHDILTAYTSCRPRHLEAWIFDMQVMEYMVQTKQDPRSILMEASQSLDAIPPTYSPQSLEYMYTLSEVSEIFPETRTQVPQMYKQFAKTALSARNAASFHEDSMIFEIIRRLWSPTQSMDAEGDTVAMVQKLVQKLSICSVQQALEPTKKNVSRIKLHLGRLLQQAYNNRSLWSTIIIVSASVPQKALAQVVPSLTVRLATEPISKQTAREYSSTQMLHVWLQLLRRLDSRSTSEPRSLQNEAVQALSKFVFKRHETARLPKLLHALLVTSATDEVPMDFAVEDIEKLLRPPMAHEIFTRKYHRVDTTSDVLLGRLQDAGQSYHSFATRVLNSFVLYARLDHTLRFLNTASRRKVKFHDLNFAMQAIEKQVVQASSIASSQRRAWVLQTCQHIIERFVAQGTTAAEPAKLSVHQQKARYRFQQIIDQANANHMLPLNIDDINTDMSIEQKAQLIHQIAHVYSISTSISQRQAWRAIDQMYRYMIDFSIPIGPLFSKAVVRCSIIRPMSENDFVTSKTLVWVCNLVATVEGEHVAKKIENVFWNWRGEIITHAKKTYVAAGGSRQDKVSVSQMKKLGMI